MKIGLVTGVLHANCCEVHGWMFPKVKIFRGLEHLKPHKVGIYAIRWPFFVQILSKIVKSKMLNFVISSVFVQNEFFSVPIHFC